jgi:hypothetical protein
LNKSVAAGLANPKVAARLAELGGIPMPMAPGAFGKLIADETERRQNLTGFTPGAPAAPQSRPRLNPLAELINHAPDMRTMG